MTITLTPEKEARVRTVAEMRGVPPEDVLDGLLNQALADAEAETKDIVAGLRASAADFAAGRWTTSEELDAVLQARRQ